ncbi:MAG: hypothetical protein Kow0062_03180 [Acidobacteriota bacterium]|nr:MAG: glycosyltransferase family 2 protein [Acidobacteriota bacterium]
MPTRPADGSCALSAIICTLDRADSLRRTLETLAAQRVDAPWEVLVVDNGSRDGTGAMVRQLAAAFPVPLRCVDEPVRGLAVARNTALDAARGAALVFLDDDVDLAPGCLAEHARALGRGDVVLTAGRIVPRLPPDAPAFWEAILAEEVGGPTSRYDFGDAPREIVPGGPIPTPFGANMGVVREAARAAGGFRTDLGWGRGVVPGEETALFDRLLAAGGRGLYLPGAVVEHRIESRRTSLAYYARWYRGFGRSTIRLEGWPRGRRIRNAPRELWRALRYRIRGRLLARRDPVRAFRHRRKAYTAEGRFLEAFRR